MLRVQRKAFLGAVGPDEVRRQTPDRAVVAARGIAIARALDLDDPCTELGELTRCERAGDDLLERDDGDALKGPGKFSARNGIAAATILSTACATLVAARGKLDGPRA